MRIAGSIQQQAKLMEQRKTVMIKYSQIKTFICIVILTINGIAHAEKPDAMPQSTYDAIINQVIADYSYYNANAVVEGVSQWLLDQPLPVTDGELIQSGNCTNCTATTLSAATGFKQPRKVKVKAKLRANGTFPSVLKIKWNRPKPLDASIINDYEVSHYLIYISKDNQSYEILRKDAKYKANGKPKQKQRIRFKDRTTGNYQVQVSAVYRSTSIRGNDKSSTAQSKASNKDGEDENSSSWTPPENFITITDPTTVGELSGAIKVCLNANNYPDTKVLLSINKDLHCSNYNLQDSDIDQLQLLSNIRAIDISNNPDITDISGLANLIYLSHLRLSDNPNISIPDFSGLTALRNLYMENMGLTAVPSLSSNDNLRVLDMSGNQIISGFENLPSNLTVIELDNNQNSNTCLDLVASGNEYEIVNISANNNDLSDCVGVSGIKYLNVIGGNFPIIGGLSREVNQDVSAFTTGLCGLNITSTNLTHLKGNAPFVAGLSLINNTKLQQVIPYKYTVQNSTLLPNVLTITEDDKMLLCSNRQAITEFAPINTANQNDTFKQLNQQKSAITPKAGTVICTLPQASYFDIPDSCSPDRLESLKVYEDISTNKRYLKWEKDINDDYEAWGVNSYRILSKKDGDIISQRFIDITAPQFYIFNDLTIDSYEVQACIDSHCGYGIKVSEASFRQAITRVTDLKIQWQNLQGGSKVFNVTFNYPTNLIENGNPASQPDYFKITRDIGNNEQIIPFTSNTNSWQSIDYDFENLSDGTNFTVYACNEIIGCSLPVSVIVQTPITSEDIKPPNNFVISTGESNLLLTWNVNGNQQGDDAIVENIDYFEILETQPSMSVGRLYTGNLNYAINSRLFYLDKDELWDDSNHKYKVRLHRQSIGQYKFAIRSCKRDRINGDVCSSTTEYVNTFNGSDNIELLITYTEIHNFGVKKPNNINTYENNGNKIISWTYPSSTYEPNYFYFVYDNTSGNNKCKVGNKTLNKFTVSYGDKVVTQDANGDDINVWNTEIKCDNLGANSSWSIKACLNGIGCSDSASVDVLSSSGQTEPHLMPSRVTVTTGESTGGPGDLLPGMWWNPELNGTGWHFYWANNLNLPSDHINYGNTYDLVGYWFAYREINGKWTPTWFETRLVQKQGSEANNGFFEGDIFYHSASSTRTDVGNLKLYFNEDGESNHHTATLYIDADFRGNIFSQISNADDMGPFEAQSDGYLKLEMQDFAIGVIGQSPDVRFGEKNNADHYSGLWQSDDKKVSVLTWIERGLEVTTIATYDDQNIPIWFQGVTCDAEACNRSDEHYFDSYISGGTSNYTLGIVPVGFNPLQPKPANHDFQGYENGYVQYIGKAGRCFSMDVESADNLRYRKTKFWANIQTDLVYDDVGLIRKITTPMGSQNNCSSNNQGSGMLDLTKQASLHEMRYTILNQDQADTQCQPTVEQPCDISFTWYTDDYFPSIEPYYSTDGGATYEMLSNICANTQLDQGSFVKQDLRCTLVDAGTYRFQLQKDKYGVNGQTITIAESRDLQIMECLGSEQCNPTIINIAGNGLFDPIQTNHITHQPGAGPIPGSGGVSGGAATYNLPLSDPTRSQRDDPECIS